MNDGGARNARFEQRAARLFQVLCDQFISVAERDARHRGRLDLVHHGVIGTGESRTDDPPELAALRADRVDGGADPFSLQRMQQPRRRRAVFRVRRVQPIQ